jgi:hypothetical protein
MSKMPGWETIKGWLFDKLVLWAGPIIVSGIAFSAHYIEGVTQVPIPYLIAAVAFIFLCTTASVILLRFGIYLENPENKLQIAGPTIFVVRGPNKKITHIKFALQLTNKALFPLSYKTTPIQVSLGGNINQDPNREVTGGIVQIGATNNFTEAAIPISREWKGQLIEGRFDTEIEYGKIGGKQIKNSQKI